MKTLYKTLVLLSLPLSLIACTDKQKPLRLPFLNEQSNNPIPTQTSSAYSFDKFGEAIKMYRHYGAIEEIRAYDFDGDGTQDIIVWTNKNKILIYQNKIPQRPNN